MRSLPLRLSPIDGESLLGYIARYSHTFQFEPGDVVRALGLEPAVDGVAAPARHGVSLSAGQLEHAALATGITTEVLEGMLLSRYAGRAFDQVSGGAAERQVWIWCSRFCPPCPARGWRLAARLAAGMERRVRSPPGAASRPLPPMRGSAGGRRAPPLAARSPRPAERPVTLLAPPRASTVQSEPRWGRRGERRRREPAAGRPAPDRRVARWAA